jgi:hypothetical protein
MSQKIQIRRGLKSSLPTLSEGELGFTTDYKEIYIGSDSGNHRLAKFSDTDTYIVELTRWGIVQGLPTKRLETISATSVNCYADADYLTAYNNMMGLNNAFDWAYSNGYRYVKVPFGSYSICHANVSDDDKQNRIVISHDNFVVDFSGATFKVMFDSVKRSPYDKVKSGSVYVTNTADPYLLTGTSITVRDCSFVTIRNIKLIGDKLDRDFTLQDEKAREHTYGIASGAGCKFCTVENCDVSFFMGDGLTNSISKNNVFIKNGYDLTWVVQTLDATGAVATSTTNCTSSYVAVNEKSSYFLQGYGSTQGLTALVNKKYSIYCYDTNKVFLTKLDDTFVLRSFTTVANTAFIRLVVQESSVDVNGWTMSLYKGNYGSFHFYRNNFIHHNHRGGMTIGVNDTFIDSNHFYNNGVYPDKENNLPGFEQNNGSQFLTRYQINMEDSQGFNINITNNRFDGSRIGIAARGWDYTVKGNEFKNNIGLILYKVRQLTLDDNYFDNSGFDTYPYNIGEAPERDWNITNNTFDGSFNVQGVNPINAIANNVFKSSITIPGVVKVFKGNTVKLEKDLGFIDAVSLKAIPLMEDCSFEKDVNATVNNSILLWNTRLSNCSFKNIKVRMQDNILHGCEIADSSFEILTGSIKLRECNVNHGTYVQKSNYAMIPENSAFIGLNNTTNAINLEFVDCVINSTSTQSIFTSPSKALANTSVTLKRTKVTKTGNTNIGFGVFNGALYFLESTVSCDSVVPAFSPNISVAHKYIDSSFTNVSFTTKLTDVVYGQLDINLMVIPLTGSGAPSATPQKLGQEYYDTTNKKLYKAFGTSASTDWVIMN